MLDGSVSKRATDCHAGEGDVGGQDRAQNVMPLHARTMEASGGNVGDPLAQRALALPLEDVMCAISARRWTLGSGPKAKISPSARSRRRASRHFGRVRQKLKPSVPSQRHSAHQALPYW